MGPSPLRQWSSGFDFPALVMSSCQSICGMAIWTDEGGEKAMERRVSLPHGIIDGGLNNPH
jgi:hypothetical protein